MSENTAISWATDTFNTHWGCTEVPESGACEHCYARDFSRRLGFDLWGNDKPRRFFNDSHWNDPLKWDKKAKETGSRRRVFVDSMSDLFEGRRDLDPVRARMWELVPRCVHSDFLLLTKRPQNILRMVPDRWHSEWPSNVWIGTTAEDQRWADIRIPFLEAVPAPVRFISVEPMLGPVDLGKFLGFVSWVLIGGESGGNARRMDPAWAENLMAQCSTAKVAVHFKQLGNILAAELECKDKAGKKLEQWPEKYRIQELPNPTSSSLGQSISR